MAELKPWTDGPRIHVVVNCYPNGNSTKEPDRLEAYIEDPYSRNIASTFKNMEYELMAYMDAGWKTGLKEAEKDAG